MASTMDHLVGITVLPEYFQAEGVDQVLANCVEKACANAITTSPYVMEVADAVSGQREPPLDAGAGAVRLLDRPLWGKHELFVRTSPAFEPNMELYAGLSYLPPPADELTSKLSHHLHEAIAHASMEGLQIYMQVQAAIPPGYRVQFGGPRAEDLPLLPDQQPVGDRVAINGSLASREILEYHCALIVDLCNQYPELTGIRVDWPEYPPYRLDSVFLDFSPHVRRFADDRTNLEFQQILESVGDFYDRLHGKGDRLLTDDVLRAIVDGPAPWSVLQGLFNDYGIADWLRLKSKLVTNFIATMRESLDNYGHQDKVLVPHAFPPPFNVMSGLDYAQVASLADHIPVKLYTMHWAMIARFYLDQISRCNPHLGESLLVDAVFKLLDISDSPPPPRIEDVRYPGPHDRHFESRNSQLHKLTNAQRAAGSTPIAALVHGYGPVMDMIKRFQIGMEGTDNRVWINRYGYLSDDKLSKIGETVRVLARGDQ
ncbi:MAG: hypothetical protein VX738_15010 [Planctomycetota bacterium]|nr:hypothetical protein [Planctomycetota bacterium]